ncbi:hypothetical protein [Streptomyces collinus]|uniref:hypothetical protein n=1 Tax=Streptomyces collinus TaxID=42684 RepID=UPI0036E4B3F1
MVAPRNIRTSFGFYPPEDDEVSWRADIPSFRDALRRDFPDAVLELGTNVMRGFEVLDFEFEVGAGAWATGSAALPSPDYAYVVLTDATAHEAALFARWLRDSYLPAAACVRFISSAAMELGQETSQPLPDTSDPALIEAVLRDHLAAVDVR